MTDSPTTDHGQRTTDNFTLEIRHGFDAPAKTGLRFSRDLHQSPRLFAELRGDRRGADLSSLATVHKHMQTLEKKGLHPPRLQPKPLGGSGGHSRFRALRARRRFKPFGRPRQAADDGEHHPRYSPRRDGASQVLGNMEFPLLGRIAAGQPVEAIPNAETFSFGDFTGGRGNLFVLRVKGDSMVDDHICNGDYILVEGAQTADNGEIVVALIEGTDATLKRFFREPNGKVRLQPANAQMDPILVPARDVKIQGRVVGVLRKY